MTAPAVKQRRLLGGERHVAARGNVIEVRGTKRDWDLAYADVRHMRLSRTRMGLDRSHLRWTIGGTERSVTVSIDIDATPSPERDAFGHFVRVCLDRVAPIRPDVLVTIGMTRIGWCLWLGTSGLALTGLVAAGATISDGEPLLALLPGVLALLAGLPVCWTNLTEGWARRFSLHEARAVLARIV